MCALGYTCFKVCKCVILNQCINTMDSYKIYKKTDEKKESNAQLFLFQNQQRNVQKICIRVKK